MSDAEVVEPGDRFISDDGKHLAIAPYKHVYHAPCKGRWIGLPLLTAFTCEFATVNADDDAADPDQVDPEVGAKRQRQDSVAQRTSTVSVSLNKLANLLTYAEKMANGMLWVKNRESECLAAGRQYISVIENWKNTPHSESSNQASSLPLPGLVTEWDELSRRAEASDIHVLLSALPQLLVLRQVDVIHHATVRHERSVARPIRILYADFRPPPTAAVAVPTSTSLPHSGSSGELSAQRKAPKPTRSAAAFTSVPRLLFVEKPFGMPVHPSGKFCLNSITRILEDVMGGADAHRYEAVLEGGDSVTAANFTCACEGVASSSSESKAATCDASGRTVLVRHKRRHFSIIELSDQLTNCQVAHLLRALAAGAPCATTAAEPRPRGGHNQGRSRNALSVFVTHRLDVATSGILMFGLDSNSARRATQLLAEKSHLGNELGHLLSGSSGASDNAVEWERLVTEGTEKKYVAKVCGNMSHCFDAALQNVTEGVSRRGAWLLLARPIYCASFFHSFYACPNDGDMPRVQCYLQALQTRFDKLRSADGGSMLFQAELENVNAERGRDGAAEDAKAARDAKREVMRRCAQSKRPIERQLTSARPQEPLSGEGDDASVAAMEATFCQVKSAVSAFRVMRYDALTDETLVECVPVTGRTHQLRVHLSYLKHPIVHDDKYIHHRVVDPDIERLLEDAQHAKLEQDTDRICLHALSYKLQFGDVISGEANSVEVVSRLPAWARP